MAVSIVASKTISQSPFWLKQIQITGVNASDGTPENVAHGLPVAPDLVIIVPTNRVATIYEQPTTYLEVAASRGNTYLSIESVGTAATATATIYCVALNFATLPSDGIPTNA